MQCSEALPAAVGLYFKSCHNAGSQPADHSTNAARLILRFGVVRKSQPQPHDRCTLGDRRRRPREGSRAEDRGSELEGGRRSGRVHMRRISLALREKRI